MTEISVGEISLKPKIPENLVKERLAPKVEKDNAGYDRTVYSYGEKTFSFKGREELPIHESLEKREVELLGDSEKPVRVDQKDHEDYLAKLKSGEERSGKHFLVNKTPLGMVELAIKLGGESPQLIALRDSLLQQHYTPEVLDVIDKIMATSLLGENGEFNKELNFDAEAVVTLSLIGDKQAEKIVDEKVKALQDMDAKRQDEDSQRDREHSAIYHKDIEPVDPKELVLIHATDYEPQPQSDGSLGIKTTGDATNGSITRYTSHFTLNHKVESHLMGSWDDRRYLVIAPFKGVIEKNGMPKILNGVDAWWTRNPREQLSLPKGTTIIERGGRQDDLVEGKGNTLIVKTEGITSRDLEIFIKLAKDANAGGLLDSIMKQKFDNYQRLHSEKQDVSHMTVHDFRELLLDGEQVAQSKELQDVIGSLAYDYSLKLMMRYMGAQYLEGGDDHIQNTEMQKRISKFATEHGAGHGLHVDSPESVIEDSILQAAGRAHKSDGEDDFAIDWQKYDPYNEREGSHLVKSLGRCDVKTRRSVYASGMLVHRRSKSYVSTAPADID